MFFHYKKEGEEQSICFNKYRLTMLKETNNG